MKDDNQGKSVVFFEHEGQVKGYLSKYGPISAEKKVIALSPYAMYELDRYDIPFQIPEDYYARGALVELSTENYRRSERICKIIDTELFNSIPYLRDHGIKPASFSIHQIKKLMDALTMRIFQINKIFDFEQPNQVIIPDCIDYDFGFSPQAPHLQFDNRESIYVRLLKLEDWNVSVRFLPQIDSSKRFEGKDRLKDSLSKHAINFIQSHPLFYNLAKSIKDKRYSQIFNLLIHRIHYRNKKIYFSSVDDTTGVIP